MSNVTSPRRRHRSIPGLTRVVTLIAGLLGAPLSNLADEEMEKKIPKPHPLKNGLQSRKRASSELPDDPALPALAAIRAACLVGAVPSAVHGDPPVEILLRGYMPGS